MELPLGVQGGVHQGGRGLQWCAMGGCIAKGRCNGTSVGLPGGGDAIGL